MFAGARGKSQAGTVLLRPPVSVPTLAGNPQPSMSKSATDARLGVLGGVLAYLQWCRLPPVQAYLHCVVANGVAEHLHSLLIRDGGPSLCETRAVRVYGFSMHSTSNDRYRTLFDP